MTFLKLSEIIHEGQSCLPTFGHLFMLLPRVTEPKLVVISLVALKWQVFKVEALVFSSISLNKKRKKSMLQLWRAVISRLVEISLPTLAQEPLTILELFMLSVVIFYLRLKTELTTYVEICFDFFYLPFLRWMSLYFFWGRLRIVHRFLGKFLFTEKFLTDQIWRLT